MNIKVRQSPLSLLLALTAVAHAGAALGNSTSITVPPFPKDEFLMGRAALQNFSETSVFWDSLPISSIIRLSPEFILKSDDILFV